MEFNTKQLGNLTELQCATYLYSLGCPISIPFGNSEKYDLIMDYNYTLYKIQCKHSSEILDDQGKVCAIKFKSTWQGHNSSGWTRHQYSINEVDFFATFYDNKCYLVPCYQCSNEKTLRILPPKNGQTKGVSFLKDYEASEVLKTL